ncbi:MAG: hypothetical protein J6B63_02430 [Treponema sp.]|nr:hypothetical protein [Treponema sp.]
MKKLVVKKRFIEKADISFYIIGLFIEEKKVWCEWFPDKKQGVKNAISEALGHIKNKFSIENLKIEILEE